MNASIPPFQVGAFAPLHKNSLRGFVSIEVPRLHLKINDLTVNEAGATRWIGMPARALIGPDGALLRDHRGKIVYAPVLAFTDATARDDFSARVIAELLIFAPSAFQQGDF
jgi:hypothetical protein